MSIAWICSRKNWDLFLKKKGAEGCFGVAAQGKGCFLCPTNGRLSFLSRLCKKEGSVNNTRLLPHAKMLLVPMNFFPCQVDYALEETFWLGKCEFSPLIKSFLILRGRDTRIDFLWLAWFALWQLWLVYVAWWSCWVFWLWKQKWRTFHSFQKEELGEIVAKIMERTARRQFEGWHLLFGEYLWGWTTLKVHYGR